MLTIAAGLSVQSIFTQRSYRDSECQAARAQLLCDHGDAFTLVNVYREWIRVRWCSLIVTEWYNFSSGAR